MAHIFWPILLVVLLAASWTLFFRFYSRSRRREATAVRRFEEIKRQLQEQVTGIDSVLGMLTGVHGLGLETSDAETKSSIAKMIVDSACQIMKCPRGTLLLVDKETNDLFTAASRGVADSAWLAARVKMGEGVSGRTAETCKTQIVDDVATDARFLRHKSGEYLAQSLVSVPVQFRGRVIGVLNVHSDEPHHLFDEGSVRLLTVLANQSAITIENMELNDSFQKFYLEMVETLVHALEMKEHTRTSAPSRAEVRAYARRIAQALDLPDPIIQHIELASLIHGIGKIGIDDTILRKPGKLTPEEYEQVKKHPEIGQEILSKVRFLSPVTPIILYHQERWDGKGYPAGLVGEEIPLGSRIVAVLNAYQAMTADRPYRKALSRAQVIDEIKKGAGSQFDPKVVEAFVKILEESASEVAP